jgi:hypothetical protein
MTSTGFGSLSAILHPGCHFAHTLTSRLACLCSGLLMLICPGTLICWSTFCWDRFSTNLNPQSHFLLGFYHCLTSNILSALSSFKQNLTFLSLYTFVLELNSAIQCDTCSFSTKPDPFYRATSDAICSS